MEARAIAAMKHGGTVPVDHMGDSRFDRAYRDSSPTEALAVLERFYTASVDDAAAWAAEQERAGYEKWSPNPLHDSPVIALADGTRIVPWPRALIARFSPSGILLPGSARVRARFRRGARPGIRVLRRRHPSAAPLR